MHKDTIRQSILQQRDQLSPAQVHALSQKVISHLKSLHIIKQAQSIAFYYPIRNETDLLPLAAALLTQNKTIVFPQYSEQEQTYAMTPVTDIEKDFVLGKFNVPEPKVNSGFQSADDDIFPLDCWLVPGVAFDKQGNRIGFGKGIYDRLLQNTTAPKIGIAYEFQILEQVPSTPLDQKVTMVITPSQIICVSLHQTQKT